MGAAPRIWWPTLPAQVAEILQELFQELHHFHKHPADHDEGRDGAGHAAHAADRQSDSVPVPSLREVGYLRPRPKGPSISAACPPVHRYFPNRLGSSPTTAQSPEPGQPGVAEDAPR